MAHGPSTDRVFSEHTDGEMPEGAGQNLRGRRTIRIPLDRRDPSIRRRSPSACSEMKSKSHGSAKDKREPARAQRRDAVEQLVVGLWYANL